MSEPTIKDAEDIVEPSPLDIDEYASLVDRVYKGLAAAHMAGSVGGPKGSHGYALGLQDGKHEGEREGYQRAMKEVRARSF